ncbi:MAG: hypothetical protein AAF747_10265, partial [Planctomycetota bacterium]
MWFVISCSLLLVAPTLIGWGITITPLCLRPTPAERFGRDAVRRPRYLLLLLELTSSKRALLNGPVVFISGVCLSITGLALWPMQADGTALGLHPGQWLGLGVVIFAATIFTSAIHGERAWGTPKCRKCRYPLDTATSLTCPECGRTAKSEVAALRPYRRKRAFIAAMLVALIWPSLEAAYRVTVVVQRDGWYALFPDRVLTAGMWILPSDVVLGDGGLRAGWGVTESSLAARLEEHHYATNPDGTLVINADGVYVRDIPPSQQKLRDHVTNEVARVLNDRSIGAAWVGEYAGNFIGDVIAELLLRW